MWRRRGGRRNRERKCVGKREKRKGWEEQREGVELLVSYISMMRPNWAKIFAHGSDHTFDEYTYICKNLCITNNYNLILGSRESQVEATSIAQEPKSMVH